MPEGTIKKLIVEKGLGFIEGPANDVFFHQSGLQGGVRMEDLHEGQR